MRSNARATLTRADTPLVLIAGLFVAAGGVIHLREWLETYRSVPAEIAGSAVVRVGFPLNAAASAVLAIALVATLFVGRRFAVPVRAASVAFTAASLVALVLSRTGSFLGWTETGWSRAASQTRAVEIGVLLTLALAGLVGRDRPVGRRQVTVTAEPTASDPGVATSP